MRNYIIKFTTIFIGIVFTIACSNTEDNLFEDSASLRLEKNRQLYQDKLESAPQGWVFQYYPHPEQKIGGFNYFVRFKNDSVIAQLEGMNNEISSTYTVLNRGGNILSFNTFNPILHLYANPSGRAPKGAEGDFEFLILNQKEDTINLKGLRTGNYMRLIKIKSNIEKIKTEIESVNNFFNDATLGANVEGIDIDFFLDGHTLNYNYIDGTERVSGNTAFVITEKGFDLYEPFKIKGVEAQSFILDKNKKTLTSKDGQFIINIAFAPIDFTKNLWFINMGLNTNYSGKMKQAFDIISIADKKNYGELLNDKVLFGLCYAKYNDIGISFASTTPDLKTYRIHYNLYYGGVVGHEDYIKISQVGPGINWKWYSFLLDYVTIITDNSPYKVITNNKEEPTEVKLVSAIDPDVWFIVNKAK